MKQIESVVDYCLQHPELLGLEMGVTWKSLDILKKQKIEVAKRGEPAGWEFELLNKRWVVAIFFSEDKKESYYCVYEAYPRENRFCRGMFFRAERFKGVVIRQRKENKWVKCGLQKGEEICDDCIKTRFK